MLFIFAFIYCLLLLSPYSLSCRILVGYKVGKCAVLQATYLHTQREGFYLALLPDDVKTAFDWLPDCKQTHDYAGRVSTIMISGFFYLI